MISSMYCDDVLNAPANYFIEKLKVHDDLLPPKALFSVRFTKNRTRSYVEALSSGYKDQIIFNSKIETVIRQDNNVVLVMESGGKYIFDKVVFACNADQALALLEGDHVDQILIKWAEKSRGELKNLAASALAKRGKKRELETIESW